MTDNRGMKPGDLVMVVRPKACCGAADGIGYIFQVSMLARAHLMCSECGARAAWERVAIFDGGRCGVELSRLIRIDPPAQPESVETQTEVVA